MLAGMLMDKGGHPKNRSHRESTSLSDLGLARDTSSRWQSIASIPEAVFEKFVGETIDAGKELTKAAALRLADDSIDALLMIDIQ